MTTTLINVIDTLINQNADTDLMWVYQAGSTCLKDTEESRLGRDPQQGDQQDTSLDLSTLTGGAQQIMIPGSPIFSLLT